MRVCNVSHNHTVHCCLSCMYDYNNVRRGKIAVARRWQVAMCLGCTGCWSSLCSKLLRHICQRSILLQWPKLFVHIYTIINPYVHTHMYYTHAHKNAHKHTHKHIYIIHIYICTHEVNMILLNSVFIKTIIILIVTKYKCFVW